MMAVCALLHGATKKHGVKLFTGMAAVFYLIYQSLDIFWFNDIGRNMIYFACGLWSYSRLANVDVSTAKTRTVGLASIILFAGLAVLLISTDLYNAPILKLLLAFAGTAATISFAMLLPSSPVLSGIGKRSLEIYVVHVLAAFGLMDVLHSVFGLPLAWPVWLIIGTVAGVVLPLILYWVCEKLRFPWLFRLPTA